MTDLRSSPLGSWSPTLEAPAQDAKAAEPAAAAVRSPAPNPTELAAHLAARLCHDFSSPASAILSGVDLLGDPSAQDMRDDALNLISTSAKKLGDMLSFARVAFGASSSAETFDSDTLKALTTQVYAHVRPSLDWQVTAGQMQKPAARALLNMAQIGATALPMGGTAIIRTEQIGENLKITIDAHGGRARIRPEVLAGLRGDPLGEGLGGHWVQAYYLWALVTSAGGSCAAEANEERVLLTAIVPN